MLCYPFFATAIVSKHSSGVEAIKYFVTCSKISDVSVADLSSCSLRGFSIYFKHSAFDRSTYIKLCGASITAKILRNLALCDRVFAGKFITTLIPVDKIV